MTKTLSDRVESCKNGCKPSDTRMFDNADTTFSFEQQYTTVAEAETVAQQLIEKARSVESDPCDIHQNIQPNENGAMLSMSFSFSCQAELIIFQMKLR